MVGAATFKEAMRMGAEVYQNLKLVIKKKYGQDGKKPFLFFSTQEAATLLMRLITCRRGKGFMIEYLHWLKEYDISIDLNLSKDLS